MPQTTETLPSDFVLELAKVLQGQWENGGRFESLDEIESIEKIAARVRSLLINRCQAADMGLFDVHCPCSHKF